MIVGCFISWCFWMMLWIQAPNLVSAGAAVHDFNGPGLPCGGLRG